MSTNTAEEVNQLLHELALKVLNGSQSQAFNYMVDYIEHPEWFTSHEGQRLLGLCIQVLKDI